MKTLPEKWCIRITEENLKIVGNFYNRQGSAAYSDKARIGCLLSSQNLSNSKSVVSDKDYGANFILTAPGNFIEITFKQFKRYILKEKGEIIGYKAPFDIEENVKKGDIYTKFNKSYRTRNKNGIYIGSFIPKEIVETWKPIYEKQEFKVKDFVFVTGKDAGNGLSYSGKDDDIFQLLEIDESKVPTGNEKLNSHFMIKKDERYYRTNKKYIIRHATKEEIKDYFKTKELLLKAEAKKRYPIGCKVDQKPAYNGNGNTHTILNHVFKSNKMGSLKNHFNISLGGIGVYNTRDGIWAPIIVPNFPDITINNYKGEFLKHSVKFGCVEISEHIFKELARSLALRDKHAYGNIEVTAVTIGKGTFTKEQIIKIAEHFSK